MGEGAWLAGFLVIQRLAELVYSQRNTRRLRTAGGVEFGAAHYPLMVALHVTWLGALWVLGAGNAVDPAWLVVFAVLQAGRLWTIASLSGRWTTRVIVLPGKAALTRGPYRWFRHPNYLIVALEFAVVPLALGLPGLAVVGSLANAAMLALRIRVENRALAWAAQETAHPAALANADSRR